MKKTNYSVLIMMASLLLTGIAIKQAVYWNLPIDAMGTVKVDFLGDFMALAYVKHFTDYIYLSNIGSWSLLIKIVFSMTILMLAVFNIRSRKTGLILMGSSLLGLVVVAILGGNVVADTIAVLALGVIYISGLLDRTSTTFLGLCAGGWLGNFIEGNIRGYVIDYAWLFPTISNQSHNLEDMMIWVGLFGIATVMVIKLVNDLYRREIYKEKAIA